MGALNQLEVDLIRLRVLRRMANTAQMYTRFGMQPDRWPVNHLWFPTPNVNDRELRRGNPPPDSERPKHLRGVALELDLNAGLPETVRRAMADNAQREEIFAADEAAQLAEIEQGNEVTIDDPG